MIPAILILVACELVGEIAREALDLPVPGPVIGLFLLAAVLVVRNDSAARPAIPAALANTAETLIGHMGLLFVPAGVGIITELGVLRAEWLPILAGLIGSTVLSLAVTGLVMHWTSSPRSDPNSRNDAKPGGDLRPMLEPVAVRARRREPIQ